MRKFNILTAVSLTFILLFSVTTQAADTLPYIPYNYDYREWVVYTPAAYEPERSVSGVGLGVGAFSNPQGLCTGDNGLVYVADTGNNRIVVLNEDMTKALEVIESFNNNGTEDSFNGPFGVYVSPNNELYIADTGNFRVVVLTNDNFGNREAVRIIKDPKSDVLDENFSFAPLKVAVDYADRVYCVSRGMFQGLMVFEGEGVFTGFFGTIEVSITPWEKFWRFFSTKAERQNQMLFIPTEFTGIDVDTEGFVYASHLSPDDSGKQAVRRLNPKGQDVVKKGVNDHVGGDIQLGTTNIYGGPSNFIDITIRDKGIYSLLDSKRGRVFTYDYEGNILYVFGGLGSQAGTFRIPSAIESVNNKIIVLDSYRAEIQVFNETNYGKLINEAVSLRFDGDEKLAVEKWNQVLKYDENFELANSGIGKSYLTAGNNPLAMKYLKIGMNRDYYSIAFKRYRNDFLKSNLSYVLTGGAAVVIIYFLYKTEKKRHKKGKDDEGGVWGE